MALTIDRPKSISIVKPKPTLKLFKPSADMLALVCAGQSEIVRLTIGSIIETNEGLIRKVVKRHRKWLEEDDAMQIARMAMITVIPKFDPDKGKWSTYIGIMIWGALRDALYYYGKGNGKDEKREKVEKKDWLGPAVNRGPNKYDQNRLRRIMERLAADLTIAGRYAMDPSMAAEYADEVTWKAMEAARRMAKLTPRARRIIEAQFGLTGEAPRTFKSIAADQGVSHQAISDIAHKALSRLQQNIRNLR